MIAILLMTAIVLAAAAWVTAGFLSGRGRLEDASSEIALLIESKQSVYRSILDLEEDFLLGKVAKEDQKSLAAEHEGDALRIIRQIRQMEGRSAANLEDELELEIAAARAALRKSMGDSALP